MNTKYIPVILGKLGAKLPGPVDAAHAKVGVNKYEKPVKQGRPGISIPISEPRFLQVECERRR